MVGRHFTPYDSELILFLQERKEGLESRAEGYQILDKKLYEGNPWDLIKDEDPWLKVADLSMKKVIYVFCKLRPRSEQSRGRVARTAGIGTWDGKALTMKLKNDEGKLIGAKRAFTFKPKKGSESQTKGKGHWMMHEYSLLENSRSKDNYVICRITRDLSKDFCTTVTEEEDEEEVPEIVQNSPVNLKRKKLGEIEDGVIPYTPHKQIQKALDEFNKPNLDESEKPFDESEKMDESLLTLRLGL